MAINEKQLMDELVKNQGNKKAQGLLKKYYPAFSQDYLNDYDVELAIKDIHYLEQLSKTKPIQIYFYFTSNQADAPLHFRLYQLDKPKALSDILPLLENLDFRTDREQSYQLVVEKNEEKWISDFLALPKKNRINIAEVSELFEAAFTNDYFGRLESDGFNKLVLDASLSWREIVILRAYAKYLHQVGFRFSQHYLEKTLVAYPDITKKLIELFKALHDPKNQYKEKNKANELTDQLLKSLDSVTSLDEDRIFRRFHNLIQETVRTNYFQSPSDGGENDYLSFKFNSKGIQELPLPVPLYEIFVYSPRFEAIHLRNTKVARGGIRWSDRREDFRREVLGLMKAQKVKNAVIIPSGAKGGFVLKTPPQNATREILQKEVVECYQLFIQALLDLTDNIKAGKSIRPRNVVCHDDIDPYLVVAADKGTATFSDIANSLAIKADFWLGDAFASGGSEGYDHKQIGITARGAWESIKRHFREVNIDIHQTDISVVGIGDMSGDVFGNGLLYSKRSKLIAAFDHRHIFLDPNPDLLSAYNERARLFKLPTSSWEDYRAELISKGGGVFKRSLKAIALSPQIKNSLGVDVDSIAPNDLIRVILKAPVDLLFNGGIGTYVKATRENHMDVGDRTNDYCRINGHELRCKVVGEGGNLGFTQLGRIEYALNGGLINTDFIDNSAGVDCSDHEVNLKILLDSEVKKGKLTYKKRNDLLISLTKEVADSVLQDNYYQALVMSFSIFNSKKNILLHSNYIKDLEALGLLNREVEFLPEDKVLLERKAALEGLTRPELAVLLAYTKIHIKNEILKSDLPEDPFINQIAETAFPVSMRKKYKNNINSHRLFRDIVATQMSNHIVNEMGITFIYRSEIETGAEIQDIIRAYLAASHIFGTQEIKKIVESLDFKIPMSDQYLMLFNLRQLINISTRWFLRSGYLKGDLEKLIADYSHQVNQLKNIVPALMTGVTKDYLESIKKEFSKTGLPQELGERIGAYRAIYTCLNIIDLAKTHHLDLVKTAEVYFASGERANLVWFRDQIAADRHEGDWDALARLTLRDELDVAQRAMTLDIMKLNTKKTTAISLVDKWKSQNQPLFKRWDKLLSMLHSNAQPDYAMFFIIIREYIGLLQAKS